MQVRIEEVSAVEKKMFATVPWDVVSARLTDAYRDIGKDVAIKGFRKGKVPRPVLEQYYAPRVHAEVTWRLVRESFFQAVGEHKLKAVAEPRLEDASRIKKGEPLSFEAIIEVRGEFTPENYTGMPVEKRRVKVEEKAVDDVIANIRREMTELKPIEGRDVTGPTDIIAVHVRGTIGEHKIDQPRFAVDLEDADREPFPGMRAALTGVSLTAKDLAIKLDIPADHADQNLRGRTADLVCDVLEGRAKDTPELNDDFAKATGRADDLAGLRAQVRGDLEGRETEIVTREMREQALRELVKRNQIAVASSLAQRAVEAQYQRLRQMMNMPPDKDLRGLSDDLRMKMMPGGADEIRGQLLLDAVGDKENVTVAETEVDEQINKTAAARNLSAARVRAEWQKEGRLDNIRYQLRRDKVMAFLVDKAVVTEVDQLTTPVAPSGDGNISVEAPSPDDPGHVHGPDCNH